MIYRMLWCVICQKMPLMLNNGYAKDVGGISTGQKITHNKPQEGVVLTPSLGIGRLSPVLAILGIRIRLEVKSLYSYNRFGAPWLSTGIYTLLAGVSQSVSRGHEQLSHRRHTDDVITMMNGNVRRTERVNVAPDSWLT